MNSNHCQVLIVEDEPLILKNIAKKVTKCSPDFSIAGLAQNGEEALDFLASGHADILITDIEMPGMGGLDLIYHIRQLYPSIHIVILSGYSNFEYARAALRYEVDDYLLKPVDQETLNRILLQLREKINAEHTSSSRNVLAMALNHSSDHAPVNHLTNQLPSSLHKGRFLLVHMTLGNAASGTAFSQAALTHRFEELWKQLSFEDCLQNCSSLEHFWLIDEKIPSQKFLILHVTSDEVSGNYFKLILEKFFQKNLQTLPYLILGYNESVSYHQLWEKAEFLRLAVGNWAFPFNRAAYFITEDTPFPQLENTPVLEDLNLLSAQHVPEQFLQTAVSFMDKILDSPAAFIYQYLPLIYKTAAATFHLNLQDCSLARTAIINAFPLLSTREEFFQMLQFSLRKLLQENSALIDNTTLAFKIRQYIELNFREQFSLPDLASTFGYTPSYINRIFKKEYGVSPLQYQTSWRIERAKKMLEQNPDSNISTVAELVGYGNPRYFSRIFKNELGISPSEWVQVMGSKTK